MKININTTVSVSLTARGELILFLEEPDKVGTPHPDFEDPAHQWMNVHGSLICPRCASLGAKRRSVTMLLWELMAIFGPEMAMGDNNPVFVDNAIEVCACS